MSDLDDGNALWRRYRPGLAHQPEPDAVTLAAYAENRLSEAESQPVEHWLAADPTRFDAVLAARDALATSAVVLGSTTQIRAARGLVYKGAKALGARVVMLRTAAWSSVAAGFVVACLIGYEAGVETTGHTINTLSTIALDMSFVANAEAPLGNVMGFGDDTSEEL
jgi:hypothetical protein